MRIGRRFALLLLALLCVEVGVYPARSQEWQHHTVSRGENLTIIARRYDVTIAQLREWNDLRSDRITIGQRLRIPEKDREWYVVRKGDNLSKIAERHDTTVALLRQLNNLRHSRIYPGQKLRLVPAPVDEAVHVVHAGETLTSIARRFATTVSRLKRINSLDSDRIYVGQQLRLREAEATTHIVERGDALWEIARTYGMSLRELRRINALKNDRIYPGQELKVLVNGQTGDVKQPKMADYAVKRGDNLHEIARLHQMSLRELRDLNGLSGSLIHPGQVLKVRPLLGTHVDNGNYIGSLDWDDLKIAVPGVARIKAGNGPYFYERPKAHRQPDKTYVEESSISPSVSYRHARKLFERFEQKVEAMGRLDNRLAGWHFVLDPGHGGIDPGAIVSAKDAEGKRYYVVEDEFVYDLSLRVYALLKLHGAEVTLTLLSPNHLLRGSSPVSHTFVHDRNEVFNDAAWNKGNRRTAWPRGWQSHLNKRVDIAKNAVKGTPDERQVFLSFHADNNKPTGNAVTLFYFNDGRRCDHTSRDFGRKLLPAMGAGARTKGRNLAVLRNNPLKYKLLVEMRNLAFDEHIWAIRYEQLRQRDAEKVVEALLSVLGNDAAGGPGVDVADTRAAAR